MPPITQGNIHIPIELGVNFVRPPLPPIFVGLLSAPEWDQFTQAIAEKAGKFVNCSKRIFPAIFLMFALGYALPFLLKKAYARAFIFIPVVSVASFFAYLGMHIIPTNIKVDAEIRIECERFSSMWNAKGITMIQCVQAELAVSFIIWPNIIVAPPPPNDCARYITNNTGRCKSKRSLSSRAIHIHKQLSAAEPAIVMGAAVLNAPPAAPSVVTMPATAPPPAYT